MVFSSILFLFYFLAAVLAVYFIVPRRFKNVVLLVFSLLFYGWGEPKYLALMIFSIVMDYSLGLWMHHFLRKGRERSAKRVLILSVVLNLALLGVLREGDHVVTTCLEHNSVLRPLEHLRRTRKVSYDVAPLTGGRLLPEAIAALVRPETRMCCVTSASNVTGEARSARAACPSARARPVGRGRRTGRGTSAHIHA